MINKSYLEDRNPIKMLKKRKNSSNEKVEEEIKIEKIKLKENVKLPTDMFYCSKRIEDGKIVCKVFCELDISFDDEKEFLEYFDVE